MVGFSERGLPAAGSPKAQSCALPAALTRMIRAAAEPVPVTGPVVRADVFARENAGQADPNHTTTAPCQAIDAVPAPLPLACIIQGSGPHRKRHAITGKLPEM